MIRLDWPLVSATQMQALDRYTIECLGVSGDLLMENAGRAVVAEILPWCNLQGDRVLVVCGPGNNGGDGFVIARHLHLLGVAVNVTQIGDTEKLAGDARSNCLRLEKLGVAIGDWSTQPPPRVEGYAVIVDAIFGTGLARAVAGAADAAIECINAARPQARVVAVDLPSGLAADTGQVLGKCVTADLTVTLGLPKPGLILEPGASFAGRIKVARIGIADAVPATAATPALMPSMAVWTRCSAGARIPERPAHGHKGSFGHLLVVAGSEGKTGAAALAAEAAGRTGAGLVTLACPASLNPILERKCTEAMTAPVADEAHGGFLVEAAFEAIVELARARDVVALGPGLGQNPQTVRLIRRLAEAIEAPLVVDADGLNALTPEILKRRKFATVLTPHPGEAGRLLGGVAASALNDDRVASARKLADLTGAVVVLKGAATVIAEPDSACAPTENAPTASEKVSQGASNSAKIETAARVVINPTGGPYLATGGTGDVLTGVIAALLAQGLPAFEAAALGVYLHGAAADLLAERIGSSGLLAGDLLPVIPEVAEALRNEAAAAKTRRWIADELSISFPEP